MGRLFRQPQKNFKLVEEMQGGYRLIALKTFTVAGKTVDVYKVGKKYGKRVSMVFSDAMARGGFVHSPLCIDDASWVCCGGKVGRGAVVQDGSFIGKDSNICGRTTLSSVITSDGSTAIGESYLRNCDINVPCMIIHSKINPPADGREDASARIVFHMEDVYRSLIQEKQLTIEYSSIELINDGGSDTKVDIIGFDNLIGAVAFKLPASGCYYIVNRYAFRFDSLEEARKAIHKTSNSSLPSHIIFELMQAKIPYERGVVRQRALCWHNNSEDEKENYGYDWELDKSYRLQGMFESCNARGEKTSAPANALDGTKKYNKKSSSQTLKPKTSEATGQSQPHPKGNEKQQLQGSNQLTEMASKAISLDEKLQEGQQFVDERMESLRKRFKDLGLDK